MEPSTNSYVVSPNLAVSGGKNTGAAVLARTNCQRGIRRLSSGGVVVNGVGIVGEGPRRSRSIVAHDDHEEIFLFAVAQARAGEGGELSIFFDEDFLEELRDGFGVVKRGELSGGSAPGDLLKHSPALAQVEVSDLCDGHAPADA